MRLLCNVRIVMNRVNVKLSPPTLDYGLRSLSQKKVTPLTLTPSTEGERDDAGIAPRRPTLLSDRSAL
jgi:hypothetical protein